VKNVSALDLTLWVVGIAFLAVLELFGCFCLRDTTFSAIVRKIFPIPVRAIIWLVLGWHFEIYAWFSQLFKKVM
jgi:hypothetical protein